MKRIGLTGGIGTGKSTVARLFEELGSIPVIDADRIARNLREPGGAAEAPLLKRFNTTDPAKLRGLLTQSPEAKKDLESILHPLIQQKSEEAFAQIERSRADAPFLIYEATLLIESGRAKDFSGLIVVTAPLPERLARIMSRDNVSKEAALRMIDSQSSDTYRLKHADYLIDNCGTLEDLKAQTLKVLDQIRFA